MPAVTTNRQGDRWAYTLTGLPGGDLYVSGYRYRSEKSARAAGEHDLAKSLETKGGLRVFDELVRDLLS